METKVIVIAQNKNNLTDAIENYMEKESIDYLLADTINIDIEKDITDIIYIGDISKLEELDINNNISIIYINDKRSIIKNSSNIVNYIITDLLDDNTNYTEAQKEYLFQNGIYKVFIQLIDDLLKNNNNYNGIIYDITETKKNPDNWIFSFDSISDTYHWLSKKNRNLKEGFTQKVISFYSEKVYNDSLNEINYLSEKLLNIKRGQKITDIFILSNEEFKNYRNNFFFKVLIKNISETHKIYLIKKDDFIKNDLELYNRLLDGVIIYDDCVYKDTYSDEISLGIVLCKKEDVEEYNKIFDYILDKYGYRLNSESDIDEF